MWRNNPWTSKRFLRFGIGTLKTYPKTPFSSGGMTGCLENDKFHKNWSFRWPFGGLTSRVNASPTSLLVVRRRWVLDGGCFGDFCLMSSKMIFKEVVNLEFFHKVWAKMKNHDWWIKWSSLFWIPPLSFVNPFPKSWHPIVGMMELQGFGNVRGIRPLKLKSRCLLEVRTPEITSFNHQPAMCGVSCPGYPSIETSSHRRVMQPKKSFTPRCRRASWCTTLKIASCTKGWYVYIYIYRHILTYL